MDPIALALSLVLFAALIALSVIDARTYRLPDWLTLPLIPAGLLAAVLMGEPLWLHALGGALGYGALVAIELAYKRLRGRPGLGRGDAKLFAAGGAWCGALALPIILLLASLAALAYVLAIQLMGRRAVTADTMIAFGPFLAFAIGLTWALQRLGLSSILGI